MKSRTSVLRILRSELAPYPGRIEGALRDTLGVILALVAAMTLRVPGISLALALLFLMQRERPGLTLRVGLDILGGAALACVGSLVWVQMTDGTETARFLGIVLCSFVSAFCMAGTTSPLLFTIVGFYGFVDLAAWDAHRPASSLVTSSLYNVASLGLVLLSAVAVEYLFGTRHPADELAGEMEKRISTLGEFFHALAMNPSGQQSDELRSLHNRLVQYAHAGEIRMSELYERIRDAESTLSRVPIGLHYRMGLLTRLVEKSVLIGFTVRSPRMESNRGFYAAIADQCAWLRAGGTGVEPGPLAEHAPHSLRDISIELRQYGAGLRGVVEAPAVAVKAASGGARLFLPGVFQRGDAAIYALKLTLAAVVCYVLYSAVAWPGILTCVVTVLFTGLSSTGPMKQKQVYRFSGALIGGLLGIATVSLLFPNMDSITSLVVVAGCVSLLAGWVMRSPRMGYIGVQIGFAFFLTTLPGFGAATQIAPARDRVIGVGLGILVLWFIFDQMWPVRTTTSLEQVLRRIRAAATELRAVKEMEPGDFVATLARLRVVVSSDLIHMEQLDSAAYFDFGRNRKRELARSRRLIRQIEAAAASFYSEVASSSAGGEVLR